MLVNEKTFSWSMNLQILEVCECSKVLQMKIGMEGVLDLTDIVGISAVDNDVINADKEDVDAFLKIV